MQTEQKAFLTEGFFEGDGIVTKRPTARPAFSESQAICFTQLAGEKALQLGTNFAAKTSLVASSIEFTCHHFMDAKSCF